MKFTNILRNNFRKTFEFPTKDVAHYFPGHMAKGMKQMQRKLKNVDCIIEIHDARIPLSGRNPNFEDTINVRPHMLILNKMDLVESKERNKVISSLKKEEGIQKVLYTNCKQQIDSTIKNKFIPEALDLIESVPRFHRSNIAEYNLLVIGVPNVGKSSFINALRRVHLKRGAASRVGNVAGVTRSVEERVKVSESPPVYVYDTPGILAPNVKDIEVGMKLAACHTLQDHMVGVDLICDYLLYYFNKHELFTYVDYFGLPEPTNHILTILGHICKEHDYFRTIVVSKGTGKVHERRPDLFRAAQAFLLSFREGNLGRINLDMEHFQ